MGLITRLKIPGVTESIFLSCFELCLDFLHTSQSPSLHISAIDLMEMFLLVFPKGVSPKLQEIRDVTRFDIFFDIRALMAERNPLIVESACRLYPLIFKSVTEEHGPAFAAYLKSEIQLLSDPQSIASCSDPLISQLNLDEIQRDFIP